jgi:hypothetical protein
MAVTRVGMDRLVYVAMLLGGLVGWAAALR